jgi:hypothetical protein
MPTNLSSRIYAKKGYAFLRGMISIQRGFLMRSWEWKRRHILRVKNLLLKRTRQVILAAGDGFAVDLPEGGVMLNQVEATLAEGPYVHQSLNEGEEQCR